MPPVYTLPIGYAPAASIPFGYSCDQYAAMGMVNDGSAVPGGAAAAAAAALRVGGFGANPLQRQVQAQVQAAALAAQTSSVWNGQPARTRSDRVEVIIVVNYSICLYEITFSFLQGLSRVPARILHQVC